MRADRPRPPAANSAALPARAPDPRAPDPRAPDPRAPDPRAPDPRAPDPRAPDLGRGLLPHGIAAPRAAAARAASLVASAPRGRRERELEPTRDPRRPREGDTTRPCENPFSHAAPPRESLPAARQEDNDMTTAPPSGRMLRALDSTVFMQFQVFSSLVETMIPPMTAPLLHLAARLPAHLSASRRLGFPPGVAAFFGYLHFAEPTTVQLPSPARHSPARSPLPHFDLWRFACQRSPPVAAPSNTATIVTWEDPPPLRASSAPDHGNHSTR
jgi:hypothetical protein